MYILIHILNFRFHLTVLFNNVKMSIPRRPSRFKSSERGGQSITELAFGFAGLKSVLCPKATSKLNLKNCSKCRKKTFLHQEF